MSSSKTRSLYEALGVDKSASPAQIKRAYREKSAKVHPDKGGNADEMAEVNRAYFCLKDSVTRLTYDQTGQEPKATDITAAAVSLLAQAFAQILIYGIEDNLTERLKQALTTDNQTAKTEKHKAEAEIARVMGRRSDLTVKSGINIWQAIIDEQVKNQKATIAKLDEQIAIRVRALELLKEYKDGTTNLTFYSTVTTSWSTATTGNY